MIPVLILSLALPCYALTEAEVKKKVIDNFPLVEAAVLKARSSVEDVRSLEGGFDHKLTFKSRNRIEDKYDNGYIESSIERLTPFRGVSLVAGHRQGLGNFPSYDGKYATSGAGELFAGLSIPFLRNSKTDDLRTSVAVGELERLQAEEDLRLKKNLYVHKALSLYYKWRLEQRKLLIRKSILELALSRTRMLEQRHQSGDLERIKLTDNERSIRKRKDEVMKSEIDLARVEAELALYLPDVDFRTLSLPIDEFVRPEVRYELKLGLLPQARIAEYEVKKLQLQEANFDQMRLPGLAIDVLGARELSANYPNDSQRLVVGLKFDYPLENRKAEGKTVSFSYKVQAADKQLTYIKREIEQFFTFSVQGVKASLARWENIQVEFENTVKMAEAEKSKWQQGSSDLFVVNLREQDVADSDIKRWTTLYEAKQYEIDSGLFSGTLGI